MLLLIAILPLMSLNTSRAETTTPQTSRTNTTPTKERLVLMPLRLAGELQNLQGAMETALVNGLQEKYIVYAGEQVSQKAREIFMKESRNTAKKECDETRCMQGIAEAFQAELLAVASITKQEGSYFIALSIQNIFDNKVESSKSITCRDCDAAQVVDKLNELFSVTQAQTQSNERPAPSTPSKPSGIYLAGQIGQVGKIAGVNNAAAVTAIMGYELSDSFGIELGYAPLYKGSNADTLASSIVPMSAGKFTLSSVSLSGYYAFPVSESIKLLGSLGVHNSNYTLDSGSISLLTGKTSGLLLGLKTRYDVSRRFGILAGVDMYNMGGDISGLIANVGAGLMLKF